MNRSVFIALILAVLLGCGGGGGGGGSSTPSLSMALSTNQIAQTAATSDPAPTSSLVLSLSGPIPADGLYLWGSYTDSGITDITSEQTSDSTATITIWFQAPSALGVGTYLDTVSLGLSTDSNGVNQIANSPQTISVTYTVTDPPPTLDLLDPGSASAGGSGFTLTAHGSRFTSLSTLQWNGDPRPTTFIDNTEIAASIPASDLATAGSASVTVSNGPLGGTSNAIHFPIQQPVFGITSVSPDPVQAGGQAFTLTVNGALFAPTATIKWNGSPRPTTFVSTTRLTAQIGAQDIAISGAASVTVANPPGQGDVSNAMTVRIIGPDAVAFQIDPGHSGAIQFNNVSLPSTSAWTVNVGGTPSYAIIVANKVILTVRVSGSTQLLALDQATGATVWGPIVIPDVANAAYDAGQVFVLSSTIGSPGLLQAFDVATGTLKWSTLLTSQYWFDAGPTAANGYVYAAGAGIGVTVYAVEQSNGAVAWGQTLMAGSACVPAVADNRVYVTYPRLAYALNPATGTPIWSDLLGGDGGGGATPVVANGIMYAPDDSGTYDGQILDAATGALRGTYAADNPPAVGQQNSYFLKNGVLRSISQASGSVLWNFAGDGHLVTSPILVNGYVFIGSSSGNLYGVDAATGQQVWVMNLGAAIPLGAGWGAPMPYSGLSAGDGLLVVPAGNTVTAFVLSTTP